VKTADEIRRHRDDLRVAMSMPCKCAGTRHAEKCVRGGCMMKAVEETLSWVLGENDGLQRMVDRMRGDVTAHQMIN
jgi:hypothetical protein